MLTHLKIARPSQPVTCIILHSTLNASRSEVKSPIIAKYVLSSQEELQNWQLDLNIYNKIFDYRRQNCHLTLCNYKEWAGQALVGPQKSWELAVVTAVKIWLMVNRKLSRREAGNKFTWSISAKFMEITAVRIIQNV